MDAPDPVSVTFRLPPAPSTVAAALTVSVEDPLPACTTTGSEIDETPPAPSMTVGGIARAVGTISTMSGSVPSGSEISLAFL